MVFKPSDKSAPFQAIPETTPHKGKHIKKAHKKGMKEKKGM